MNKHFISELFRSAKKFKKKKRKKKEKQKNKKLEVERVREGERGTYYYPCYGTTARWVLLSLPFTFRLVASPRCLVASPRCLVAAPRCVDSLHCVVAWRRCVASLRRQVMSRERIPSGSIVPCTLFRLRVAPRLHFPLLSHEITLQGKGGRRKEITNIKTIQKGKGEREREGRGQGE